MCWRWYQCIIIWVFFYRFGNEITWRRCHEIKGEMIAAFVCLVFFFSVFHEYFVKWASFLRSSVKPWTKRTFGGIQGWFLTVRREINFFVLNAAWRLVIEIICNMTVLLAFIEKVWFFSLATWFLLLSGEEAQIWDFFILIDNI